MIISKKLTSLLGVLLLICSLSFAMPVFATDDVVIDDPGEDAAAETYDDSTETASVDLTGDMDSWEDNWFVFGSMDTSANAVSNKLALYGYLAIGLGSFGILSVIVWSISGLFKKRKNQPEDIYQTVANQSQPKKAPPANKYSYNDNYSSKPPQRKPQQAPPRPQQRPQQSAQQSRPQQRPQQTRTQSSRTQQKTTSYPAKKPVSPSAKNSKYNTEDILSEFLK